MDSFSNKYSTVQVISQTPTKKISIVKDAKGQYHIAKKLYTNDEQALKQVIEVMKTIKHPNIVEFHDLVVENKYIYLVEEFCEEGDLGFHIRRQIRKKKTYFTEDVVSQWLLQILLALEYLQNQKIMHRDIRPQNIFLTTKGNIKLGSFKSSKIFQGQTDLAVTLIGSPYYMAPEFVQKQKYDFKVDIWAFGCVMFELCALRPIYNTKNMVELAHKIMKGKIEELPFHFSKQLNTVLTRCLTAKPIERPTARQLLQSNYFLTVMQKFVLKKGLIVGSENRIPIKRYKIHNKILENAKIKRGIKKCASKEKKEEFPRIQIQTARNTRKTTHCRSKELLPRTPIQSLGQKKSCCSVEKRRNDSGEKYSNNGSKQKKQNIRISKKTTSKTLQVQNGIKYSPILPKKSPKMVQKAKKQVKKQQKKQEKKQQKKEEIIEQKQEKQRKQEKKKMLPPPMLPRPTYLKPQQKKIDLSNTMKNKDLQAQLSQLKEKQENKKFLFEEEAAEVKENLAKLFDELNMEEDDQEQFSFDLEDENMARLTMHENENNEILKTYKTKLEQMIEEINYKYCPNMQPIQERTNQFDSNTFAQFHS